MRSAIAHAQCGLTPRSSGAPTAGHSIPPELRRTLTYDQGSEMASHKTLAQRQRMDIFFCDANKPWHRGSNENANGIIRRYLPKGLDLSPFTDRTSPSWSTS